MIVHGVFPFTEKMQTTLEFWNGYTEVTGFNMASTLYQFKSGNGCSKQSADPESNRRRGAAEDNLAEC